MARKTSKARIRANRKYNEKAYDRIEIKIPKGEKIAIKQYAEEIDSSVNAYITGLIYEDIGDYIEENKEKTEE